MSLVAAGDHIWMQSGTYTGASYMINPPDNVNGSSGSPITVSAINEGQVLIDGQGVRDPILLQSNDWWIIEGVNAKNGPADDAVVGIGSGADNNIIRRVCAWDAEAITNTAVFWDFGGTNNLLEDVCAFGWGRKMIANGQSGDSHFTVRRAFAYWLHNNDAAGPIAGAGNVENVYNSFHGLYENVIASGNQLPDSNSAANTNGLLADGHFDSNGLACGDGSCSSAEICSNGAYYGSIGYSLSSQTKPIFQDSVTDASQYIDCRTFENVVSYAESARGVINLRDVTNADGYPGPFYPQIYRNGTDIGTGAKTIGASWTVTNRSTGNTVGDVPNIWNGGGSSGARVCYRYVDGVLTSTPLWPWPMNQRIKDAMTAGGYAAVDVTQTMEDIFGAIPPECTTGLYASASGGGTCTAGSPCLLSQAMSVAVPGTHIWLEDGTYTGANSMIDPASGKSGTAGSPITVSAINEGQVLIDGQGARVPIHLENNDYWVIEGVNAKNSNTDNGVVEIYSGADYNIIRRVCAWDAHVSSNSAVFFVTGGTHNLFEDICAFGTGRKSISVATSGDSTVTIRRAFAIWHKSTSITTGSTTCEWNYFSRNTIWENVICTADQQSGSNPASFEGIGYSRGINNLGDPDLCANTQVLGSIIYHLVTQTSPTGSPGLPAGLKMGQYADCQTVRNTVSYMGKALPAAHFQNVSASVGGPTGQTQTYANGTEISSDPSTIESEWTVSNRATGFTVSGVPNIWNGTGSSGARVCYRYVNGTLTATPLWPWPMNQRIIDAMASSVYTPVDVTKTMEDIFGTIPTNCGGVIGGTGSGNTRTTRAIDNFTGTAGVLGTPGWAQLFTSPTVNRDGSGHASGTSTIKTFQGARRLDTYSAKQYAQLTITTFSQASYISATTHGSGSDATASFYRMTIFPDGPVYTSLEKVVNGSSSQFVVTTAETWVPGDTIALEVINGEMWGFHNGSVVLRYTDTNSPLTTGTPGFEANALSAVDDFDGGDLNFIGGTTGGGATVFAGAVIR